MKLKPGMRLVSLGGRAADVVTLVSFDGDDWWLCSVTWWSKGVGESRFARMESHDRVSRSVRELLTDYSPIDTDDPNEVTP